MRAIMVLVNGFVIKLGRKSPVISKLCCLTKGGFQRCFSGVKSYCTVKLPDKSASSVLVGEDWMSKIIYNEIVHKERISLKLQARRERFRINVNEFTHSDSLPKSTSRFLRCMSDRSEKEPVIIDDDLRCVPHFPFKSQERVLVDNNNNTEVIENSDCSVRPTEYDTDISKKSWKNIKFEHPRKWEEEIEEEILCDDSRFGSCDPDCPVSSVPCGGCGALLHCTNMAVPGFMPQEVFKTLNESDLRKVTCQRCFFLKEYNVALSINVSPDEYPKILSQIKSQKALVLLMIDLLDFPCSIWPNLPKIIGENKPIFLVANKADLLIQDGEDFLKHRKKCLMNALELVGINMSRVLYTGFISAKTGYGVESLITQLYNLWGGRGDIYIVGCTNVGKSTLFNMLIQSDMCKVKAVDVLQRATVSEWPGTTMNLVKFPLLKPLAWRRSVRSQRIRLMNEQERAFLELKKGALRNKEKDRQILLMGFMGRTFESENPPAPMLGLNPKEPEFQASKWCYDTPGVVHDAQILTLLTTQELVKVLPAKTLIPRNFKLNPGHALFIGGIARLDFVSGYRFAWFTVYASEDLPVTITNIEDADFVYEKLTGTHFFAVPCGKKERIEKWPPLRSEDLKVCGKFPKVGAADVVLSSAGWVAITTDPGMMCSLRAWTPDKRGIFLREPSIIRNSSSYRKRKISGTPAYTKSVTVDDSFDFHLS